MANNNYKKKKTANKAKSPNTANTNSDTSNNRDVVKEIPKELAQRPLTPKESYPVLTPKSDNQLINAQKELSDVLIQYKRVNDLYVKSGAENKVLTTKLTDVQKLYEDLSIKYNDKLVEDHLKENVFISFFKETSLMGIVKKWFTKKNTLTKSLFIVSSLIVSVVMYFAVYFAGLCIDNNIYNHVPSTPWLIGAIAVLSFNIISVGLFLITRSKSKI